MVCYLCGGRSKVIRTAITTDRERPGEKRRRRRCETCGDRVTTIEYVDADRSAERHGPAPKSRVA